MIMNYNDKNRSSKFSSGKSNPIATKNVFSNNVAFPFIHDIDQIINDSAKKGKTINVIKAVSKINYYILIFNI